MLHRRKRFKKAPSTKKIELPKSESLLDRNISATGGKEALHDLKSLVFVGVMINDIGGHNYQAKIRLTWEAPNKQHTLFDRPMNMVRVTNGTQAWMWKAGTPGNLDPGKTEWLTKSETKRLIDVAESLGEVDWRKKFKSTETKGVSLVNDKLAYKVQVTTGGGESYSRYFDKDSGRLVKTTRVIHANTPREYELESVIDRYEEFGKVWLATKLTHTLHSKEFGVGTQIYEYSDVTVNDEIQADLFKIPAEFTKNQKRSDKKGNVK